MSEYLGDAGGLASVLGTAPAPGLSGGGTVLADDLEADAVVIKEIRITIGDKDPAAMKPSEIRAELKILPEPTEVITKARENMDTVNAMVAAEREELRRLEGEAQAQYVRACEMADQIRLRRKALAEAAEKSGKVAK
jgi:hypothetical protein